ncbi:probable ATP-dependent RNA helicase DDX28 [Schistocerca americana]|uniref:probable ATP-dependent RNA helicase DDX28 n=1 Tax=Schistocerca americana TaxID=7009 RepID=UPI001F4F1C37|nr:probable ATP-dependent RNA helicase DDX28 [Schistocerca americana]
MGIVKLFRNFHCPAGMRQIIFASVFEELLHVPRVYLPARRSVGITKTAAARHRYKTKEKQAFHQDLESYPTKYEKEAVITCKRQEFNHYKSQTYRKFEVVPLASKGWYHKRSKGDYFIINAFTENPATAYSSDTGPVTFNDLGLNSSICSALEKQGITAPTRIQAEGIPAVLSGHHTLLSSETGGGKTLAYLLPLLQQILLWKEFSASLDVQRCLNTPLGLVICPGRELAHQIGDVANQFKEPLGILSKVIVGGRTKKQMLNPDVREVDLLIATIGALSKLTTTGVYKMNDVCHVVLDEADTLLDDSFNEKVCHLLKRFQFCGHADMSTNLPQGTQLTLVSATMPTSLPSILGQLIEVDSLKKVTTGSLHQVMTHIPQKFIRLGKSQKPEELLRIAKSDSKSGIPLLIFSNKSSTCDWISLFLNENGVSCINLNGAMPEAIRTGKFKQFQSERVNVISCTDIGSRGLDTVRVKHVLNYDFPVYMADYIHRCGRTGRVGSSSGCHITNFVEGPREIKLCQDIEHSVRKMIALPNVNANIKKIISYRLMKGLGES